MRRRRTVPALLFGLSVFFTLAALTAMQATGPTAAPRLLGRLAGALFELERWMPAHQEDLQAAARDRGRASVEVRDLPITVFVPSSTVLSGETRAVDAALAGGAGERLYLEGRAAFRDGPAASGDMSLTDPVRWTITLLGHDDHAFWKVAFGAGALATTLTGLLMLFVSSGGFTHLARVAMVAAVGYAAAIAAVWLLSVLAVNGAPTGLEREIARITRDIAVIGLRAGLAVAAASLALLVLLRLTGQGSHAYADWPALDEAAS